MRKIFIYKYIVIVFDEIYNKVVKYIIHGEDMDFEKVKNASGLC